MAKNIDKIRKELLKNGQTNPVLDYSECIFEKVFVETTVDTDKDGKLDLIAVLIKRPKETIEGLKVPAIFVASPYVRECNEDWYIPHDVDVPLKVMKNQDVREEDIRYDYSKNVETEIKYRRETKGYADTAESETPITEGINDVYSYFLSRGYACIYCGGLGTLESEGFTMSGSREEVLAFKSVIDWLNGNARAFTDKTNNIQIKANWCTGSVAMSGKSYLGTMCIGVATTGVKGLKTIIPEAGISNWYNYYRKNGLVAPAIGWQGDDLDILAQYCFSRAKDENDYKIVKEAYSKVLKELVRLEDRESGNYNRFWDERNYLNQVKNMKASVFIIHGINDLNVMMNQNIPLWNELKKNNISSKMLLHQGDHIYVYNHETSKALEIMHKWLDYHLYGIDNRVIDDVPSVIVQNNLDQNLWHESNDFPPMGTEIYKFPVNKEGEKEFIDDIKSTAFFLDEQKSDIKGNMAWRDELVLPMNEEKNMR
jgi:X-Pro dipeptidyl-peptidase